MKCGSCTECCTPFDIPELRKPAGLRCMYLTDKGCSIYDTRPQTCRDFKCAFLFFDLDKKLRPDKAGFIMSHHYHNVHGPCYTAYVVGKISNLARKLLRRARKKFHPDRKILWCDPKLEEGKNVYEIDGINGKIRPNP